METASFIDILSVRNEEDKIVLFFWQSKRVRLNNFLEFSCSRDVK
jgi:hypothetical protein